MTTAENGVTVSYIGYDKKDENAVYRQHHDSRSLEIGGTLSVRWFTVVERYREGERIHGLERWLDERS